MGASQPLLGPAESSQVSVVGWTLPLPLWMQETLIFSKEERSQEAHHGVVGGGWAGVVQCPLTVVGTHT